MLRAPALFLLLTVGSTLRADVRLLPALPNAASSATMQLDAVGNIYVVGSFSTAAKSPTSAFVAKLSADGKQVYYFTVLAGSVQDAATALALGVDGSAFVAGNTTSFDFPVTAGALESSYSGGGTTEGFLVKVNPAGSIVYSTFITGPSTTQLTGIALDGAGDVFLTGIGGPGYSPTSGLALEGFVAEVNAALNKVLLSIYGYGGGLITLDSQSNIYLAGSAQPEVTYTGALQVLTLPPLPAGAFQSTHGARFC